MEQDQRDPEDLLPLSDGMFYILWALTNGEKHGYAIMKEVKRVTDEKILMGTGTLYRSLSKMAEAGIVEFLEAHPEHENEDERRRYYRITPAGYRVVLADCELREEKYQREQRMFGELWPRAATQST